MADEQYYPPAVPKVDHQKILVKCAKVCNSFLIEVNRVHRCWRPVMLVTNFVVNITEVANSDRQSQIVEKVFINVFQFFNRAEHKKHNLFNQEEVFQFTDFLQIIWNECKGEVRFQKNGSTLYENDRL